MGAIKVIKLLSPHIKNMKTRVWRSKTLAQSFRLTGKKIRTTPVRNLKGEKEWYEGEECWRTDGYDVPALCNLTHKPKG